MNERSAKSYVSKQVSLNDHKTSQQRRMVFIIVHDRRDTSLADRPLNALGDKLLSRKVDGKLFQIDGPSNAKRRCPVDVLTLGN